EKLDECPTILTEREIANVLGPSYVAGKFLCRLSGSDTPRELAFMRIYKQIPIAGTEYEAPIIRAVQATGRLNIKSWPSKRTAVILSPKLLGYQLGKQGETDLVPGGYILYLVWEKVPGESLDFHRFWSCPFSERQEFRAKFRRAYETLVRFGYRPQMPGLPKIIYEWATGEMHISGFRCAVPTDPSQNWNDLIYVQYSLALATTAMDKYYPVKSTDLYHDAKGWGW
ncbi:hypothetical protein N7457_009687, partial [Penicillium paradoxum]|uniref:uncharacterized protein n=1 Tax=Penicillium paradoxum TaxID=176176 RepID=UPI002548B81B